MSGLRTTRAKLAITLLPIAAAIGLAAGASSASPKQLPERFTIYSANVANKDMPELMQATGPISGIGTAKPNDDAPGNTVPITVTLAKGKVFMAARGANFQWKPNLKTCTATAVNRGTYTISGGTGAYRGATGGGTFHEHGAAIGARGRDGACLQKFKLNYVVATLHGKASVGG